MSIPYSLVIRPSEPGKSQSPKRVYPVAQSKSMSLQSFAKHCETHGIISQAAVLNTLKAIEKCLKEEVMEGYSVDLGMLGCYRAQIKSRGADSVEHFSSSSMSAKLCVTHYGDKKWLDEAQFTFAGTRKSQAEARKQDKARIESELSGQGGTPGGGGSQGSLED